MVPRGEVGIVVASIGAAEGVVDAELFGVVVGDVDPDDAGGAVRAAAAQPLSLAALCD